MVAKDANWNRPDLLVRLDRESIEEAFLGQHKSQSGQANVRDSDVRTRDVESEDTLEQSGECEDDSEYLGSEFDSLRGDRDLEEESENHYDFPDPEAE